MAEVAAVVTDDATRALPSSHPEPPSSAVIAEMYGAHLEAEHWMLFGSAPPASPPSGSPPFVHETAPSLADFLLGTFREAFIAAVERHKTHSPRLRRDPDGIYRCPECDPLPPRRGCVLSAADPQPPPGTVVRDDCGVTWINSGCYPAAWIHPDGEGDPESWTKIAGNYGPVTVIEWGGGQ